MPKRPNPDDNTSHAATLAAAALASQELTPLAILLATMREKYRTGDFDGAVALARIAAPYLHPRIPAANPPTDLAAIPDADLDAILRQD